MVALPLGGGRPSLASSTRVLTSLPHLEPSQMREAYITRVSAGICLLVAYMSDRIVLRVTARVLFFGPRLHLWRFIDAGDRILRSPDPLLCKSRIHAEG